MRWPASALFAALLSCQAQGPASSAPVDASLTPAVISIPTVEIVTPPKKLASRHVLIVGDSEACAVATYIDLKKTVRQANEAAGQPLDVVDVDCKGGTVVQYWGAGGNLRAALSRHPHPDAVLVFLGTNHYWQNTTPPTSTVTDLLKDTNCVWVGNTAVHGKRWKINDLIRAAVTPQCKYFDTEAADIPLADGVHPTPGGATKWVKAVWPLIPPKYEETDE